MTAMGKIQRDFTRFFNDQSFPYKVTVCLGKEQIICSGVLLAQQSEILERMIREENGMLMFHEFIGITNSEWVLHQILEFLHGTEVQMSTANIDIILKFASFYKVKDLFKKGIEWITQEYEFGSENFLDITEIIHYFIIGNYLDEEEADSLKSIVLSLIDSRDNVIDSGIELDSCAESLEFITGDDLLMILEHVPRHFQRVLEHWVTLSTSNKKFILDNASSFHFNNIFLHEDEFTNFIDTLAEAENLSSEHVKVILMLRENYFNPVEKVTISQSTNETVNDSENEQRSQLPEEDQAEPRPGPSGLQKEVDNVENTPNIQKQHLEEDLPGSSGPWDWRAEQEARENVNPRRRELTRNRNNNEAGSASGVVGTSEIFVGNLPQFSEHYQQDIIHLFASPIGQINNLSFRRGRGRASHSDHAFISYTSAAAVTDVLQRYRLYPGAYTIGNRQLRVNLRKSFLR